MALPSLREILAEQANILESFAAFEFLDESPTPEELEAHDRACAYLDELAGQEARKVDNIAGYLRAQDLMILNIRTEEQRLANRRRILERRAERMKDYIRDLFRFHGLHKVSGTKSTLSLRRSEQVHLSVEDRQLPDQFVDVRMEYKADRKAIREALKQGKEVPGAKLVENFSLQIK